MKDEKFRRTMEEAFGPYISNHVYPLTDEAHKQADRMDKLILWVALVISGYLVGSCTACL